MIYYVDSINGNDANTGTSTECAWKTIGRVNDHCFEPGDQILLKRGCVFRDASFQLDSGAQGNPLIYSSYGEGPNPVIQPSLDLCHPELWHEVSPDIWRTAESFSFHEDGAPVDLRQSSWRMYIEPSADAVLEERTDGVQKTLTLSCRRNGGIETALQLIGPSVQDVTCYYRFSFRMRASIPFELPPVRLMYKDMPWSLFCNSHGTTVNVTESWQEFSVTLYNYAAIPHGMPLCINFSWGTLIPDGVQIEFAPLSLQKIVFDGAEPLLVDIGNIIFNGGEHCGWKKWSVEELTAERDYYHDDVAGVLIMRHRGNPGAENRELEGALKRSCFSHTNAHDVVVDGIDCRYSGGHGFGGSGSKRVIIRNCDLSYIGGSVLWVRKGRPTRFGNGIEFWCDAEDNLVEHNRIWQVYDVAITNQGGDPNTVQKGLHYRNNLLFNCEQSYEFWRSPDSSYTEDLEFSGNTCLNAGDCWGHPQRPNPVSCHLLAYSVEGIVKDMVIRNNVMLNARESLLLHYSDLRAVMDCDYNLWYQEAEGQDLVRIISAKLTLKTEQFSEWQTVHGKDAHSVYGAPKFLSPDFAHPENGDFRLAPDSEGYTGASDGGPIGIRWKHE